jgi:hypothetical protein
MSGDLTSATANDLTVAGSSDLTEPTRPAPAPAATVVTAPAADTIPVYAKPQDWLERDGVTVYEERHD